MTIKQLIYLNIFVKLDIEWAEHKLFHSISPNHLLRIKQMAIEFHSLDEFQNWDNLKKINETHYLVHAHGNNCMDVFDFDSHKLPQVIELTYIRKKDVNGIEKNKNELPGELDSKNDRKKHEILLDFSPFIWD